MRKLLTIIVLFAAHAIAYAQPANSYVFESSTATYAPLQSETVLWSGTFDNEVTAFTIPAFSIAGTAYTTLTVSSNGFITFGGTAPTATYYTPVSGSTAYHAAVSAFGLRLNNAGSGSPKISYNTNVGNEIVIQWQDVKRQAVSVDERVNFQIRLNTATGEIKVVYGDCSTAYTSTGYAVQVGLRGGSNSVFNNRSTTSDWANTIAGTASNANCRFNNTVLPATGLVYSWTLPPVCSTPLLQPENLFLNPQSTSQTNGSFTAASGADAYLVVRTTVENLTENPASGIVYSANNVIGNGIVAYSGSATSFNATGLTNGVQYYFHVFSMNNLCTGGPLYLTNSPLSGSAYTIPNGPSSFNATTAGSYQIDLTAAAAFDIMVAWNTSNTFGSPIGNYSAGDAITGGGTVLYIGSPGALTNHSGIEPGVTYYYRCWTISGTSYSTAVRNASATTNALVPFAEGFEEGQSNNAVLTGWAQAGTGSYSWSARNNVSTNNQLPRAGAWSANLRGNSNRWMFKAIELTGSQTYKASLYARQNSDGADNASITIAYGENATAAAMTNTIVPEAFISDGDYQLVEGYFQPATSGLFYLGINGYANANTIYLTIDDVAVELGDECAPPTMLKADNIGSTSARLSWNQFGPVSEWNIKYGVAGFDPGISGTLLANIASNPYVLSALDPLTEYDVYLQTKCNGNVSEWSNPVRFSTIVDPLSGNYTINKNLATGGSNFNSFADLLLYLNVGGISGNVIIDVEPGTGPYNEQIVFNEIAGVSSSSTITINGNGIIVEYLSTDTNQRATLKLDGAKYIHFNGLTIKALGENAGEFGFAAQIMNGSAYSSFTSCHFSANETSTSTNFAGLVISNNNDIGNLTINELTANHIVIDNCTITGGYHGVVLYGSTNTANVSTNNSITNTHIRDFYAHGIRLSNQTNAIIEGNEVYRSGIRAITTTSMIYFFGNLANTLISNNKLYNFSGTVSSSLAYGIEGGLSQGSESGKIKIVNNLIYGFAEMNSNQFGINLNSSHVIVAHNTISLDYTGHTNNNSFLTGIRWAYQTSNGVVDILNNIIHIKGNNSSTKTAIEIHYGYADGAINCNHNAFYIDATTGQNRVGRYNGTNYTSLANWQNGSGFDMNSIYADPFFTDNPAMPLLPQNAAIDNMGTNLMTIVPVDFGGNARTAAPDPGAWEFNAGCLPVASLSATGMYSSGGTSAKLQWVSNSGESQWDVEYGPKGFAQGTGQQVQANDNPYVLTGLQALTEYDFYVRARCSGSDFSQWVGPKSFTTLCPSYAIPYENNFDALAVGQMPVCWTKHVEYTATAGAVTSVSSSSPNSMEIRGTSNYPAIVVLPEFDMPLTDLMISFMGQTNTYTGGISIGTVNSPAEPETYTEIAYRTMPYMSAFYIQQVVLAAYEGTHKYLAFKSTNTFFIDDLKIETIAPCIIPRDLKLEANSATTASFSWTPGHNETRWQLLYGYSNFDPQTEGTLIEGITNPTHTIEGLDIGGRYQVYLRSECGSDGNSSYTLPLYFTTECGVYDLPYTESFNYSNGPLCWTEPGLSGSFVWVMSATQNRAEGSTPYEAVARSIAQNGTTRLVTPPINTAGTTELKLSFKTRKMLGTPNRQATLKIQSSSDKATWTNEQWSIQAYSHGTNEAMEVTLPITNNLGAITYIAFVIDGNHSAYDYWAIDDIVIEESPCTAPSSLSSSGATSTSAVLNWEQTGIVGSWNIQFGRKGFPLGSGTVINTVNNPYTLSGLDSSSEYEYYVQSYCGEGAVSYWAGPHSFATLSIEPLQPLGNGTAQQPYEIASLANLYWIRANPQHWDKHYIQTENIDASSTAAWYNGKGWLPIGTGYPNNAFTGQYNGQYFTIDGLHINSPSTAYAGLFGATNSAQIRNLGLTNVFISGLYYVGALVGSCNYSTIENCYSTGRVIASDDSAGGLCGELFYATLRRCFSLCLVEGSYDYAGGLAGEAINSVITDCYARGNVSSEGFAGGLIGYADEIEMSNCYSTGRVGANYDYGGLIGYSESSSIYNSFWDTESSYLEISEGGTPKTSDQMKTISTFTLAGWDFKGETQNGTNNIWDIDSEINNGYPFLSWQTDTDPGSTIPTYLDVNQSFAAGQSVCVNALMQITVAGNGQQVVVSPTAEAVFIAGQTITFLPGFHAQAGSYVNAYITTSGEYCNFAPPAPIVQAEAVVEKSIVFDDFGNPEYELFAEKQVLLYPNPNNGRFTIQLQNFDKKVQLMVVNLLGKVVFQANVSDSDYFEINMLNVQRGVYSVVVTDNKTVQTRKIVVY